ncbi:MAG TPA: hypothetical protein VFO44_12005 [Steroidobacteraceae bacterium]|nr:hypothetical protein [Steroidobacteraceae bacterium]
MIPVTALRTNRLIQAPARSLSAGLAPLLAAAGLLLVAPGVQAAEPSGDAQAQARSILLATTSFEPTVGSSAHQVNTRLPDVQEQARSILVNKTTFGTAPPALASRALSVPAATSQRVHRADAQDGARALLLGRGS